MSDDPLQLTLEQDGREPRRFTVDEYYRMWDGGIFDDAEQTELIDGLIRVQGQPSPKHACICSRLLRVFTPRFGARAHLRVAGPVGLGPMCEPRVDAALCRPREDDYETRHPGPEDIFLVVEVADATLDFDLGAKAMLYAAHDVPELWVVDANADRIVVHRKPSSTGYGERFEREPGEELTVLAFPDDSILVTEILERSALER